ncbi:MAG TPA: polyprenyl synthetase family protein [Sulfolobales archaeon]|nr:polyprenyl synthetase family protein [Sulfolobales archaeon]
MSLVEDHELRVFVEQYIALVNKRIHDLLRGEPETLYRASSHLITAGGKRLRPLVLGLVAKGYGVDPSISSIAGASIEILHNFTLVHDDIMDRDEFRRGIPTTHRVYGEEMAILAGDLLFAKSYEAILSLADVGVRLENVLRIARILNWASITVAEGQALDMMLSKALEASDEQYLEMIYKKTSALFVASAMIGAILGDADREDLENIERCFKNAGIAFQIRDDLIGLIGDPSVTGKPILSDIREGKRTIMVIHALRSLPEEKRRFLTGVLGNREASIKDLERARELMIEAGSIKYAEDLIKRHVNISLESLERIKGIDKKVIDWIRGIIFRLAWRES